MRSIQCILMILCSLAAVVAQTTSEVSPVSQSRSSGSDPFTIRSGSSFAASAPASSRNAVKAARDREKIIADLREAESLIANNYVGALPTVTTMTTGAIRSMLHSLDPHSNYFDAEEWKEMLVEQESGYAGIGIAIESYRENGVVSTYVLGTFDGSPARRSGLAFGDKIVAVNGVSMIGSDTDTVSNRIRGSAGTVVKITVERNASGRVETLDLKRGVVPQPSIPDHYMIKNGVGYIGLTEGFNYTTSDEFSAALADLHRRGMTSLIVDLRGNGGGIVDQAVKVAEKFLPAGTLVVSQRGRTAAETFEWRSSELRPETLPLVLLVDENTASASEIVAGSLQDNDRALIVGHKTFGKGLVQSVIDLPQRSGLTLTAARYFTPSGRSIQREYSDIGRYDYYNHRPTASAIDTPYFETYTLTGRKVTGGDGIQPDVLAVSEAMDPEEAALVDPIFLFARELASGRVSGIETARFLQRSSSTLGDLPDLTVGDDILEKFAGVIGHRYPGDMSLGSLRKHAEFIKLRLEYELSVAKFGPVPAARVLNAVDLPVTRASGLISRAADLAVLAAKASQRKR